MHNQIEIECCMEGIGDDVDFYNCARLIILKGERYNSFYVFFWLLYDIEMKSQMMLTMPCTLKTNSLI